MTAGPPPEGAAVMASTPSPEFRAAVPELERIHTALLAALRPTYPRGQDGYAVAAFMMAKGLRFLLDAADPGADSAEMDAALREVEFDLAAATGHVRDVRAAGTLPDDLAAAEGTYRMNVSDVEALASSITAQASLPESFDAVAVRVAIDGDGRVSWSSDLHGELPVGGRAQLDLAAALALLGQVFTRALQERPGDE